MSGQPLPHTRTRPHAGRGAVLALNRALDVVARVRCSSHPETRAYVERRLQDGRTRREIRRSLKRYIARQIYRQLNAMMTESSGI